MATSKVKGTSKKIKELKGIKPEKVTDEQLEKIQKLVDTINRGEIHIVEPDLDTAVASAVEDGYLKAATKAVEANNYLIVVPTPFKGKNEPDISFVEAATRGILTLLKEGDLYIIESTSPVGTTEKMMDLIYKSIDVDQERERAYKWVDNSFLILLKASGLMPK